MTIEREVRILGGLHVEERKGHPAPLLTGYAAVFGVETDIAGVFRERIAPSAFADAISKASADVHALFNHDSNVVLGRLKAGTLRLAEDDRGLAVEIDPPDTQDIRDLLVKMRRGDIDQMSFAFTMRGGAQSWDESQNPPLRTIEKVGELFDVSVVTRGAYPTTDVGVRGYPTAKVGLRSLDAYRAARLAVPEFCAASMRVRLRTDLDLRMRRMVG